MGWVTLIIGDICSAVPCPAVLKCIVVGSLRPLNSCSICCIISAIMLKLVFGFVRILYVYNDIRQSFELYLADNTALKLMIL